MFSAKDKQPVYSSEPGRGRSKVYTFRLSAEESRVFDETVKLMRMSVTDACREGMFGWVENANEHLGELAAKEAAERKWARECSDPRGAAAWAKRRDGLGRLVRNG